MDYGMACRRASPSKVIGSRDICLLPSLISRQLPASQCLSFRDGSNTRSTWRFADPASYANRSAPACVNDK
jgi:hypothetical protein